MFYLAQMMTEANALFLKLTLIYLSKYHKQNILKIYAGIKTMFRTASLVEVSSKSCDLTCLSSLRIYVIWSCWLHSSSSPTLNNWDIIQDNYTLCLLRGKPEWKK